MLDFTTTGMVKHTSTNKSKFKVGYVYYNMLTNKFYITRLSKRYNVDGFDFNNSNVLYSLPSNENYISWTKKKLLKLRPDMFKYICKSWSTLKPKLKVKGDIKDDIFTINYKETNK